MRRVILLLLLFLSIGYTRTKVKSLGPYTHVYVGSLDLTTNHLKTAILSHMVCGFSPPFGFGIGFGLLEAGGFYGGPAYSSLVKMSFTYCPWYWSSDYSGKGNAPLFYMLFHADVGYGTSSETWESKESEDTPIDVGGEIGMGNAFTGMPLGIALKAGYFYLPLWEYGGPYIGIGIGFINIWGYKIKTETEYPPEVAVEDYWIEDRDGDGVLSGYEEGKLVLKIKNRSSKRAVRIEVMVSARSGYAEDVEILKRTAVIPSLSAYETETVKIPLKAKTELGYGNADFNVICNAHATWGEENRETRVVSIKTAGMKKPLYPPELEIVSVEYIDLGDRDRRIDAREKGRIEVLVKNSEKTDAFNVEVILRYPGIRGMHVYPSEKQIIRKIPRGSSAKAVFNISCDEDLPTGEVSFEFVAKDPFFGAMSNKEIVSLETEEFVAPMVVVHQAGIASPSHKLEPNRTSTVSFLVWNKGGSVARNVRMKITLPEGVNAVGIYAGEVVEIGIGDLEPGQYVQKDIDVFVRGDYPSERVRFDIKLSEAEGRFAKDTVVVFGVGKYIPEVDRSVIEGLAVSKKKEYTTPPSLVADVDVNIPSSRTKRPDAVGVIVWIKDYRIEEVPDVEFADRDGEVMKEYLVKVLGYKKENIIQLQNPTKADIERVFGSLGNPKGQLSRWIKPGVSEVFVYYVGHGAPDPNTGKGYLVPSDAHPDYVNIQGYPLEVLYDNLATLDVKHITVVIDACFSGETPSGMIIAQASPLVVAPVPGYERIKGGKLTIMTASKGNEIASWYPEKKHSLFTYYFLKGLRGEADKNHDRKITIGEMEEYLKENVSYIAGRLYNRDQHPEVMGRKDRVLVEY